MVRAAALGAGAQGTAWPRAPSLGGEVQTKPTSLPCRGESLFGAQEEAAA